MTEQYQMDLADMRKFHEQNDGTKYLLVANDCFSRKASVQPLPNKNTPPVKDAINQVIKDLGVPERIQFDKGREFINKTLEKNNENEKTSLKTFNTLCQFN
ncbi:hypothetical protein RvY_02004 [Ramazzottius varieornatus]|uniref:Integrase catalytic domain-containing protein n=1 Tax=Ramazzottius varieornatus TaxID=947166 RepID=A0A1D1UM19_RAMVA|nr:hypothetical protein RvY_02004 [Ramazzottius varieornatus]